MKSYLFLLEGNGRGRGVRGDGEERNKEYLDEIITTREL